MADEQTRERKLRAARMAAASAVGNGCDPDEVRRQIEAGIAEALALERRQTAARESFDQSAAARPAAERAPEPQPGESMTPALDRLAERVA